MFLKKSLKIISKTRVKNQKQCFFKKKDEKNNKK